MFKKVFKRIRPNQIAESYRDPFVLFFADPRRDVLIVAARSKNTTYREGVGQGNGRNGASTGPRYDVMGDKRD